jgi:hypothetical protein
MVFDDRRYSTYGRRRRTRWEVLTFGEARVHHVHVWVDASGQDHETVRIDDLVALSRPGGRALGDSSSDDKEVAGLAPR